MNTNDETMPRSGSPSPSNGNHANRGILDERAASGGTSLETSHPDSSARETPTNPFLVSGPFLASGPSLASGPGAATHSDPFFNSPPVPDGHDAAAAWSPGQLVSRDLIEAVRAIENKNTGGFTKLLVLLVSMGVFMAAGMAWWNPRMIGMLVIVLLFHEAGHYLAMKTFGYRNVKMFFIPFLGAAVSGRHFNIAGWKKAIVYLAGPVPGIVVALPLMGLGSAWETDWMYELGAMSLLLNALNLLPILPLDGGWIMHLTVFSRSPLLELLARVAGIAIMIAMGIFAGSKFLFVIAIPLLISLPTTFRISKLIRHMRDRPLPQPKIDQIPDEAIEVLNQEMESTALSEVATPQKAALLIQMYESLIVRPPGFVATLAIWFLYGGSLMVALVGGSTMYAMRGFFAGGFFDEGLFDSTAHVVVLDPTDTDFVLGSERLEDSLLAVAQFNTASELSTNLKQIAPADLDRYTHLRIGDVLLATVPKDAAPGPNDWMEDAADDDDFSFDVSAFREQMRTMFQPVNPVDTWLRPIVASRAAAERSPRLETDTAPTDPPDPLAPNPSPGAPIIHVISGMHHDSVQLMCRAPSVQVAHDVTKNDFQMPGLTADRLYIPNWSPIDPPTAQQIANREVLKTLVNGIQPTESPQLFEARNKLYQAQYKRYDDSEEPAPVADAVRAAKFQSKIRELEAKYTSDRIASLRGEEAEVARSYQSFQNALHEHSKKMALRRIDMESKRQDQGDDFSYDDFEVSGDEETYPSMDQFLNDDNGMLGFGDPQKPNFAFAAHVSGEVLTRKDYDRQMNPDAFADAWEDNFQSGDFQSDPPTSDDASSLDHSDPETQPVLESGAAEATQPNPRGEFVSLHIHRATDYTATVSAIIAHLQRKGFTDFSLHYVTPKTDHVMPKTNAD